MNEFSLLHETFKGASRRARFRAWASACALTLFSSAAVWRIGAEDRELAALYRATAPVEFAQMARIVGADGIGLIRDVVTSGAVTSLPASSDSSRTHSYPPTVALKMLLNYIADVPSQQRPYVLRSLLRIAVALGNNDYINSLVQLERLPDEIRQSVLANGGRTLKELVERSQLETDVATLRQSVRAEVTRLRCDEASLHEVVNICYRARGVETLPRR